MGRLEEKYDMKIRDSGEIRTIILGEMLGRLDILRD